MITPGIGGGFGCSYGVGWTEYPYELDVHELAGFSTKVGCSFLCIGIEVDDTMAHSLSFWKPSKGADFHATINRTWVFILREN